MLAHGLRKLKLFADEDIFHGMKYVFKSTAGRIRRILWLIVILITTLCLIVITSERIKYYLSYPYRTDVSVTYPERLPLPAFTFCTTSPVQITKYTTADIITYGRLHFLLRPCRATQATLLRALSCIRFTPEKPTFERWNFVQPCPALQQLFNPRFTIMKPLQIRHILRKLLCMYNTSGEVCAGDEASLDPCVRTNTQDTYLEFLRRTSRPVKDLINSCTWERERGDRVACPHQSITEHFIYPFGRCFTINNNGGMFATDYISIRASLSLNLSIDMHGAHPVRENSTIPEFNPFLSNTNELPDGRFYIFGGLLFHVHSPGVLAHYYSKQGWKAITLFSMHKILLSNTFRKVYLGQPYNTRDCVCTDHDDVGNHCRANPLKAVHKFSREACTIECISNKTASLHEASLNAANNPKLLQNHEKFDNKNNTASLQSSLRRAHRDISKNKQASLQADAPGENHDKSESASSCILYDMLGNFTVCRGLGFSNLQLYEQGWKLYQSCYKQCMESCETSNYKVRIESDFYTMPRDLPVILGGVQEFTEASVQINIYVDSFRYLLIRQSPIFTIFTLLANIGGNLGLLLGGSVLSLLRLTEFTFQRCSEKFGLTRREKAKFKNAACQTLADKHSVFHTKKSDKKKN